MKFSFGRIDAARSQLFTEQRQFAEELYDLVTLQLRRVQVSASESALIGALLAMTGNRDLEWWSEFQSLFLLLNVKITFVFVSFCGILEDDHVPKVHGLQ